MCRDTSLGVGEALKREIAGLFLGGLFVAMGIWSVERALDKI